MVSILPNSSDLLANISANFLRCSPLSVGDILDHGPSANALYAESTALLTSDVDASGIVHQVSPVVGFELSKVLLSEDKTHSPPINILKFSNRPIFVSHFLIIPKLKFTREK